MTPAAIYKLLVFSQRQLATTFKFTTELFPAKKGLSCYQLKQAHIMFSVSVNIRVLIPEGRKISARNLTAYIYSAT
jgi:hypothetical protein